MKVKDNDSPIRPKYPNKEWKMSCAGSWVIYKKIMWGFGIVFMIQKYKGYQDNPNLVKDYSLFMNNHLISTFKLLRNAKAVVDAIVIEKV